MTEIQAPLVRAGAICMALNSMGDHNGNRRQRHSSRAVEQGQDRRAEGTVQAQGHLGAARPPSDGKPSAQLALFNLAIDSKLRGCDLVALRVRDVCHGDQVATRAIVMQHKTQRPVQFETTQTTRDALQAWIRQAALKPEDFLLPSRLHDSPHLGTRQYARILGHWVDELGLDRADYGTHSMRRTKATLIS